MELLGRGLKPLRIKMQLTAEALQRLPDEGHEDPLPVGRGFASLEAIYSLQHHLANKPQLDPADATAVRLLVSQLRAGEQSPVLFYQEPFVLILSAPFQRALLKSRGEDLILVDATGQLNTTPVYLLAEFWRTQCPYIVAGLHGSYYRVDLQLIDKSMEYVWRHRQLHLIWMQEG